MKTFHKISRQQMEMKTRATVVTRGRVPLFVVGDATVAFRRNCDRGPRVFGVGVFRTVGCRHLLSTQPLVIGFRKFEILSSALQTTQPTRKSNRRY